jgi:hypothetical protein
VTGFQPLLQITKTILLHGGFLFHSATMALHIGLNFLFKTEIAEKCLPEIAFFSQKSKDCFPQQIYKEVCV